MVEARKCRLLALTFDLNRPVPVDNVERSKAWPAAIVKSHSPSTGGGGLGGGGLGGGSGGGAVGCGGGAAGGPEHGISTMQAAES